jgi:hypothetical protein
MAPAGALKGGCRLPSAAASRVYMRAPRYLTLPGRVCAPPVEEWRGSRSCNDAATARGGSGGDADAATARYRAATTRCESGGEAEAAWCDITQRWRETGVEEKLELRQSGDGGGTETDPGGLDYKTEAGAGAGDGAWRQSWTTKYACAR